MPRDAMSSSTLPSPFNRRQSSQNPKGEVDLAQSLKQLSLSSSPSARQPHIPRAPPLFSSASYQPSAPALVRPVPRSPSDGRGSQTGTPPLPRKASTNSLHSVSGTGPASHSPSRRSSSSQLMTPIPIAKSPLSIYSSPLVEIPTPTAASVAAEYFKRELEVLHGTSPVKCPAANTDAVVILHDACYGHRYSRPRTSRAALSTVVERPERIKASVLGLSMAYVRLGQRHSDGAFSPHPKQDPLALPKLPFRIEKTARRLPLTSPTVTNVHGTKWMEELKTMCDLAESRLGTGERELKRTDKRPDSGRGAEFQEALPKLHDGDLYLCADSLAAIEGSLGAVCDAVDTVFTSTSRRVFVAVRPPGHHCSASFPSGFCWVNNVQVGIMHGSLHHGLTHAAIIDFDLHHGDGSQSIAWEHNSRGRSASKNAASWKKTAIGYFSLHDINSYPCEDGDDEKVKSASLCINNAHGQSIWNVHLEPWKSDDGFWDLFASKYSILFDKARNFLRLQAERLRALNQVPRGAIFLSAGFDASEWEGAGMQRHNVNVPTEFYARVTHEVVKMAVEEGTGVGGRVISVLEGGYSDRALISGICSHLCGLVGDPTLLADGRPIAQPPAAEMWQAQVRLPGASTAYATPSPAAGCVPPAYQYKPTWWSSWELERLEAMTDTPVSEPKKARNITASNYSSPTQASTARALEPTRYRRSLSGAGGYGYGAATPSVLSRAPTPPLPDVPWEVAAYELSRLLVPIDRSTRSCTAAELTVEASKSRRDKHTIVTINPADSERDATLTAESTMVATVAVAASSAANPSARVGLRERKVAKAIGPIDEEVDRLAVNSRRKTAAPGLSSTNRKAVVKGYSTDGSTVSLSAPVPRRASRRHSAVSALIVPGLDETPPVPHVPVLDGEVVLRSSSSLTVRPESPAGVASAQAAPSSTRKKRPAVSATRPNSGVQPKALHLPGGKPFVAPASQPLLPTATPFIPSSGVDAPHAGQGVDNITAGMKKIKISLITKAQKEARAKLTATSASASAAVAAVAARTTTTPSPESQRASFLARLSVDQQPLPKASFALLPPPLPPRQPLPLDPRSVPLPASPRLEPATTGPSQALQSNYHAPALAEQPVTSPLRRSDLPVFTVESSIPFWTPLPASGQASTSLPSVGSAS